MTYYNNREYKVIKNNWKEFLQKTDWHLWITFTFERKLKQIEDGYTDILQFFKNLNKLYPKVKFSSFSIGLWHKNSINKNIHFHTLIVSNMNYPMNFRQLNYKDIQKIEELWTLDKINPLDKEKISHFELISDKQESDIKANYIAKKNIRIDAPDEYQVFIYGSSFLKKLQKGDYYEI